MKRLLTTTTFTTFLLISGSVVSAQTSVSVGVQIGPPPPPRVVYVVPSPPPEPEYVWIEGSDHGRTHVTRICSPTNQ